jgi:hypothetical protein
MLGGTTRLCITHLKPRFGGAFFALSSDAAATGASRSPWRRPQKRATGRPRVGYRQRRCVRRIGMGLRLPLAIARTDRSGIGNRGCVEFGNRSGKTGFRHVEKAHAWLRSTGKLLVVHQQFAEQQRPLRRIVRTLGESRQGLASIRSISATPLATSRSRAADNAGVSALRLCANAWAYTHAQARAVTPMAPTQHTAA